MTNYRALFGVLFLVILLPIGCTTSPPQKYDDASPFALFLAELYEELAAQEEAEYDWSDADAFRERAIAARSGRPPQPEAISDRDLGKQGAQTLTGKREDLMEALARSGRSKAPELAAQSQVAFDCWMQELEEGFQQDDIAACQQAFETAYAALYDALDTALIVLLPDRDSASSGRVQISNTAGTITLATPLASVTAGRKATPVDAGTLSKSEVDMIFSEALAAQPPIVLNFTLYFVEGTEELTEESKQIFLEVVGIARMRPAARINVFGHTDTVGSAAANAALAAKRARIISQRLISAGLEEQAVAFESFGETRQRVSTPDDTPEPRNRRVEIILR